MRVLIVCAAVVALALAGCQSGPGSDCDTCAQAEANPLPGGAAAAAAAAGGQSVGQDPRATDTARLQPNTVIGRGAGPTTSSVSTNEGRVVASGAGVTQGLQVPTAAGASASGGSVPVAVAELQEELRHLRAAQAAAYAAGDYETYKLLLAEARDVRRDLMTAQAQSGTTIHNTYNQQGQRVIQSVVSGTSGGDPTDPPISEEGGKAAAGALTKGSEAVMTSPPEPAATFPPPAPSTGSAVGPDPDVPPAGPAGDPNGG